MIIDQFQKVQDVEIYRDGLVETNPLSPSSDHYQILIDNWIYLQDNLLIVYRSFVCRLSGEC